MNDYRQHVVAILFFPFSLLIAVPFSHAGVEEDISELKKDVSEIKKELQEIKRLLRPCSPFLQKPPTPSLSEASIDDDPILGDKDAPLTLIEFSDYQCAFCGRFSRDILPWIKREYIDTGKVRYVFRDYPLPFHKNSMKAAEAAQCAGDQGRYWEMHDLIFENQQTMESGDLKGFAERIGLDIEAFSTCLDTNRYAGEVRKDVEAGRRAGVGVTPFFVLGRTTEDGKIKGKVIHGVQSSAFPDLVFKSAIEALLKGE